MKLADAQTDSDRQRLRESNLIDLENAFKEESPLSDSYDESSASCAAAKLKPALAAPDSKAPASIDQVLDKKLPAQNDTVDGSGHETFPGGLTTGSNLPNGNATSVLNPSDTSQKENIPFESMPQRSNQATVDFSSSTKMNGLNTNGNASDTSEPDPFVFSSVPTRNNTSLSDQRLTQPTSGLSSGNNLNLNRRNPLNSGDSESDPFVTSEIPPRRGSQLSSLPGRSVNLNNSTYQGYYDEDPNYWRRTIIAAIIIVLAIIGLAIGLLAPGIRVEKRPNNGVTGPLVPTFSPAPTAYMPPEGTFSDLYTSAADILIRSEVSPPGTLSRQCRHILCDGDGDISRLTVQERALHFLVFQDATYKSWVFQGADNNINTERVVQRYVITLFAFSTGLEKDAEDLWESATWFEYDKWLEGGNECDWFGLTCAPRSAYVSNRDFVDHTVMTNSRLKGDLPGSDVEEMYLVIGISLNKNNLRGQLPQEIFKLRHLERIELWKNQITGKIHGNIRLLTSLQRLWLHETKNLYGKIPSQIGDLTKLESIFLGGNRLSGTIPTVVGKLSKLNTFAAFDNQLEGNIPEELSSCTELQRLFLDQNNLNGTIPQMIGSLRQLEDFRIHDNKLEGTLPPQMTLLNNLKVLYVNNNMLTGSLSDAIVSGLISLEKLEASENRFTGTVSTQFGRLPNLDTLVLHSNELNSEIPRSICDAGSLLKIDVARNKFIRGKIPTELANCPQLKSLTLSNNAISGPIPAFFGQLDNLQILNLDNNKLTGQIPTSLASAASLDVVRLINNDIEGVVNNRLCESTLFISADCGSGGSLFCSCTNCCCNDACN